MSQKIHQLPESLVARIAAGEVVERPASVLKELIENSLDAGATEISVVIEGAGRTRLQVSDNGSGMSQEDAHLALRRHATSKITDYDDLEALETYGFRGEALPSIAAVSQFRLVTRLPEEESGWALDLEGGKLLRETPAAREPGTTIEVKNLFFNTPARFKFMKSDATERSQCLRVIEEAVFHSLNVGFHVQIEDGKPLVLKSCQDSDGARPSWPAPASRPRSTTAAPQDNGLLPKSREPSPRGGGTGWGPVAHEEYSKVIGSDPTPTPPLRGGAEQKRGEWWDSVLRQRIGVVWNSRLAGSMVPVHSVQKFFQVWGLVSHPDEHAATPKNQILFVNNRPVQNRRLTRALYDAYVGQLFVGRHPSWVLFLNVDPKTVDVNVHPSKREVKLAFESEIFGFLVNAVRSALQQKAVGVMPLMSSLAGPEVRFAPSQKPLSYPLPSRGEGHILQDGSSPRRGEVRRGAFDSRRGSSAEIAIQAQSPLLAPELSPLKSQTLKALAQLNNMFILAESQTGFVVVDQHAAAEKILYEKLMKGRKSKSPQIQMMLVPTPWEVALSVAPLVKDKCAVLQEFGFLIDPFGGETFLVKGVPSELGEKTDLLTLLDGLTDVLSESSDAKGGHERNFEHKLIAMASCKGSVRAGDPLDLKACQHILDGLVQLEAPHTCPHGRPTIVEMSYHELQRRFRRT